MQDTHTLVIHYHLFKCAGSSVERVLRTHFRKKMVSYDKSNPGAKISVDELISHLAKLKYVHALTSHQLVPPLPRIEGTKILPVIFIRHPIDRILSNYRFERQRGPITPNGILAAEGDLKHYIETQLERGMSQAMNFHVRQLSLLRDSSCRLIQARAKDHMESAAEFLAGLPVVGVVERFPTSAVAYENLINAYFPSFRFPSVKTNVTSPKSSTLEIRMEEMQEELGEDLWNRLMSANKEDFELYAFANKHLDSAASEAMRA